MLKLFSVILANSVSLNLDLRVEVTVPFNEFDPHAIPKKSESGDKTVLHRAI